MLSSSSTKLVLWRAPCTYFYLREEVVRGEDGAGESLLLLTVLHDVRLEQRHVGRILVVDLGKAAKGSSEMLRTGDILGEDLLAVLDVLVSHIDELEGANEAAGASLVAKVVGESLVLVDLRVLIRRVRHAEVRAADGDQATNLGLHPVCLGLLLSLSHVAVRMLTELLAESGGHKLRVAVLAHALEGVSHALDLGLEGRNVGGVHLLVLERLGLDGARRAVVLRGADAVAVEALAAVLALDVGAGVGVASLTREAVEAVALTGELADTAVVAGQLRARVDLAERAGETVDAGAVALVASAVVAAENAVAEVKDALAKLAAVAERAGNARAEIDLATRAGEACGTLALAVVAGTTILTGHAVAHGDVQCSTALS